MPGRRWLRNHAEAVLLGCLLLLAVVLMTRRWVCGPTLIVGNSMLPTLRSGQLVLINKLAYRSRPPERGDIVLVWTGRELWTKRVLGLPGEEIEIRNGTFYVNGSPLREPYVRFNDSCDIASGRLGPNRFVVAGDNRQSVMIVVVNRERILGRLMFVKKSQ